MSLIEVKLRPAGPWRVGHRAGDRERVDVVYHSDALYSAVTHAMRALGWLGEWLDVTANAPGDPAVRFSSLFPFLGKTRLVAPPKSVWPPALAGKLYLHGAKLIPLEIVKSAVVDESRWTVDGESECMVPLGSGAPFRVSMRSAAAVDRFTGVAEPHRTACLEFASNAGWWGVFSVSDAVWEGRVKSALRLLADSGFGGERSRGWGRAGEPHFSEASHLFAATGAESCWWLLSLYSPHSGDAVDWSRSEYTTAVRGGWTDSPAGAGAKKQVRMMEEGSVLAAASLRGRAVDVAPDAFPHPVYRAGFALAIPAPREILLRVPDVRQPAPAVDLTQVSLVDEVAEPEMAQPGVSSLAGPGIEPSAPEASLRGPEETEASRPESFSAEPEPRVLAEIPAMPEAPRTEAATDEPTLESDAAPLEIEASQADASSAEPEPEADSVQTEALPESPSVPEAPRTEAATDEPALESDTAPLEPEKLAGSPEEIEASQADASGAAPEPEAETVQTEALPESPAVPEAPGTDTSNAEAEPEPDTSIAESEALPGPPEEPKPSVPHKPDEVAE